MTTPRILVVADDPLIRASLSQQIANLAEFTVTGSLPGIISTEPEMDLYSPDLVLWDLGWDPVKAGETLKSLHEIAYPVLFLVPEGFSIENLWSPFHLGFLYRNAAAGMLEAALKAISLGILAIDPQLTRNSNLGLSQGDHYQIEQLTPRELEVLQLLSKGKPNKAIALDLGISDHTVKFHVTAIMGKLSAQSRTDAVVIAARLGLINL